MKHISTGCFMVWNVFRLTINMKPCLKCKSTISTGPCSNSQTVNVYQRLRISFLASNGRPFGLLLGTRIWYAIGDQGEIPSGKRWHFATLLWRMDHRFIDDRPIQVIFHRYVNVDTGGSLESVSVRRHLPPGMDGWKWPLRITGFLGFSIRISIRISIRMEIEYDRIW